MPLAPGLFRFEHSGAEEIDQFVQTLLSSLSCVQTFGKNAFERRIVFLYRFHRVVDVFAMAGSWDSWLRSRESCCATYSLLPYCCQPVVC